MLLDAVLHGSNPQAELLAKFRDGRGFARPQTGKRRTVAQLLKAAEERAQIRRRQERERAERERIQHEQEAQAARERHLNDLAKHWDEAWAQVDQLIATKQPRSYDEAVTLLGDLRELAVRDGKGQEVSARLLRIQTEHEGKSTFISRLRKAGLE